MDSTVKVVGELLRDSYWTLNGRGWSGKIKVFVNLAVGRSSTLAKLLAREAPSLSGWFCPA
jgi:hypothetical protein